LEQLLSKLNVGGERVVCVPGNHDVEWNTQGDDRMFHYKTLVKNLGARSEPSVVVLNGPLNQKKLALVLMDSCKIEGKAMSAYRLVGDHQLKKLSDELDAQKVTPATHHILAVMHHHLMPIWPVYRVYDNKDPLSGEPARYSMTADAGEILRKLRHWG